MIIHRFNKKVRQTLSVLLLLMLTNCSGCVFFPDFATQLKVRDFEPFTMKDNMIVFLIEGAPYYYIHILDTDNDKVIRYIELEEGIGVAYPIKAGNKIYVMDEGRPYQNSYTVCAIYPEKGTSKQIRLNYPLPRSIIYNPISRKLLVEHGSSFPEKKKETGGSKPVEIINCDTDEVEKTLWFNDDIYFFGVNKKGEFYFRIYVYTNTNSYKTICLSGVLDVINEKTNIFETEFAARGSATWQSYFDHTSSIVEISNLIFMRGYNTNLIKVYDINNNYKVVDMIYIDISQFVNENEEEIDFINCIDYYPDSNYIFIGGRATGVLDLNTEKIIKWLTNYPSGFRVNNHKLYYFKDSEGMDILSITNDFKLIKTITTNVEGGITNPPPPYK